MTLEADLERFPLAAQEWEELSGKLLSARARIDEGRNDGWRFGILAETVGDAHDLLIGNIYDALDAGSTIALSIASALHATARDFGMTDAEQATYLRTTKDEI
ncbi:MAG TPA: hypothetical protein VNT31_12195 [Nocardioides sp.]|nr:hypothetical protein [Nocardioides sp.]